MRPLTSSMPEPGVLPYERLAIARIFERRRLQVLRIVIPGLLTLVALPLPLATFSWNTTTAVQLGLALATFLLALLGMILNRPTAASNIVIVGSLISLAALIYTHGPSHGKLATETYALLFLLIFPIILAGILAGPIAVLGTVVGTFGFSLAILATTKLTPDLLAVVSGQNTIYLLAVPQLTQIGVGFLMFAGTIGVRRMQGEVADLRIAYAREKDLEQLREQFISNVNHELRSPIMALQGYIGLAKELVDRGNQAEAREMLVMGEEVAEHLADLVKSILAVRRLREAESAPELAPITIAPLLDEVIHTVAMMFDARGPVGEGRFSIVVPPDLAVMANTDRLMEVCTNLLTNAIKYSPPDSPIIVSANLATPTQRRLFSGTGPFVLITVRDYGAGIPPEKAVHIFEAFVRLDRDDESSVVGTGLGLAICRANVAAMQGFIWVESAGIPGEGSSFVMALPAVATTTAA